MTNAETILKLNEALTSLIKAYEGLQGENGTLKQRVNELEDEVLNLELINEDLEKSVNELKSNTEDDKTTIYSMLGQIENILNKSDVQNTKFEQIKELPKHLEQNSSAFNPVINQNILESSFGVEKEPDILDDLGNKIDNQNDENKETNILNSFSYNQEKDDKNEKQDDDNKIDLSDGRVNSLLGINQ